MMDSNKENKKSPKIYENNRRYRSNSRSGRKHFNKYLYLIGLVVVFFFSSKKEFHKFLNQERKQESLKESVSETISNDYVPLVRIVDGDTIHVMLEGKEVKVRLIGIDTPEAVSEQRTNVEAGEIASQYVKNLLADVKEVKLEFDEEEKDKFGRYLAYVYLPNGEMLNLILAQDGMVRSLFYEPNTKYKKEIIEAIKEAKKNKIGLWKNYTYKEMFPSE